MAISHKPGTVFNSPETQQWAVHGQPTCPTSVSPFGTEFLTHFLSYKHPSIIYSNLTTQPVSGLSRTAQKPPKFLQFPSHVLGLIKRPIPGLYHTNTLFKVKILEFKRPKQPLIFWAVTAIRENPKKIPTIRSHVLGPIKRPLAASNQSKHGKTLKNGNKTQVGRKSYLLELSKTRKPGVHA